MRVTSEIVHHVVPARNQCTIQKPRPAEFIARVVVVARQVATLRLTPDRSGRFIFL